MLIQHVTISEPCHLSLVTFGQKGHSSVFKTAYSSETFPHTHTHTQLVVPTVLQNRLFDIIHSGPLAAHLGAEHMLTQLRQHYYWPGMRRDVFNWCWQCTEC